VIVCSWSKVGVIGFFSICLFFLFGCAMFLGWCLVWVLEWFGGLLGWGFGVLV